MKMKNKIELKKSIIISIFVILIWSSIFALFNLYQYSVYTNNFNNKIDQIVTKIATEYPDIQKSDVIEILNGDEKANGNILKEYGIDLKKDILDQMDFKPTISKNIKRMDERIFMPEKMNIKKDLI